MKKLFSILVLAVFFTGIVVAQTAEGFSVSDLGITDSDCKNFAKNYKKIEKALEKLNADLDSGSVAEGKEMEECNKVLAKNGISGPNEYLKGIGIMNAYSVVSYELELDKDRLSKAVMKKSKVDPTAAIKAAIGKKDYEAVKKNYKALAEAFGDTPIETEKKKDTSFGDVIGDALGGGKKGAAIGKGVDSFIKKKGKSDKIADHLEEEDE